jgi:hypothetical protein
MNELRSISRRKLRRLGVQLSTAKSSTCARITLVPLHYTSGPFPESGYARKILLSEGMPVSGVETKNRRASRTKAVLPVRIKGTDSTGEAFDDLAHTLDVTPTGLRLGSVRRELSTKDEVTVFFRQRKMQFRVVWTKKMKGTSEFQVGLQALTQEKEAWGLSFAETAKQATTPFEASPVSVLA